VLLQTGLLLRDPLTGTARASLATNQSGQFIDRWVHLRSVAGRCLFLQDIDVFELPVAHGEGRFVTRSLEDLNHLDATGQLVLRYAPDSNGVSTNPNGAAGDVAGACDESGQVLGLMPHPERFIDATQHPAWNTRLDANASGAGLALFASAVKAVSS